MSQMNQISQVSPEGETAFPPPPTPKLTSNPVKAAAWFRFAKREGNLVDGSFTYWLSGIREDPFDVQAVRDFLSFADARKGDVPKIRELEKTFLKSGGVLEEYIAALFRTAVKPAESAPAAAVVRAAVGGDLLPVAEALAARALEVIRTSSEKPVVKKDAYYTIAITLREVSLFQLASQAARAAKQLFPQDTRLGELDRDLASLAYTQKTGLDQGVKEGTFRDNIKDPLKQRQLEEEGRIAPTQGSLLDRIQTAKARYEAAPTDASILTEYCKLLTQSGTDAHEQEAIAILEKGALACQSKLFRQQAADLRMRRMDREVRRLKEEGPSDACMQKEKEYWEYRKKEFALRLSEEPKNSSLRFEYGRAHFELKEYRAAIELLQLLEGGDELTHKSNELVVEAFLGLGFYQEAWCSLKTSGRFLKSSGAALTKLLSEFVAKLDHQWIDTQDTAAKKVLQEAVAELLARDIRDPVGIELRARLY